MQKQEIISEVQLKTSTALNSWLLFMAAHSRDSVELLQQVIFPCHVLCLSHTPVVLCASLSAPIANYKYTYLDSFQRESKI